MLGFAPSKLVLATVSAAALVTCAAAVAAPGARDARGSPDGLRQSLPVTSQPLPTLVPPVNDHLATATVIGSLPFSEALGTVEATAGPDDPFCHAFEATVWYSFTPATTAWVTADTIGSDYDTTLSAYTGSQGSLSRVACNDDAVGAQSRVSFLAEAGITYHLLVAGWSGGGNLVVSLEAAGPFAKIPVKATSAYETSPAAGSGAISWAEGPRGGFRYWTLYVQGAEIGKVRVNRSRTSGFSGGFEGNRFVYQEARGRRSNLQFFNLERRTRSNPPAGVNTRHWEWHPTISGDWLLFGRRTAGRDIVLLRNLVTGRTIVLDSQPAGERGIAEPGQVAGNYAVWFRCTPICDVFLYDIAQRTKTKLPRQRLRQHYDPSVTSDGTVYFVRSGRGCGTSVKLVRRPLGGPSTELVPVGAGRDTFHTYALEHGDGASLFFESVRCSNATRDVYRIVDP